MKQSEFFFFKKLLKRNSVRGKPWHETSVSTDLVYRRREYHRRRRRFCFIYMYIYIYLCLCPCTPPPPPLRLFSSLVHKIENNLTFSWLKATQTINLMTHFPSPLLSPSIYIEDDRDEYLLILPGLHS
jgi:hypothetical protein